MGRPPCPARPDSEAVSLPCRSLGTCFSSILPRVKPGTRFEAGGFWVCCKGVRSNSRDTWCSRSRLWGWEAGCSVATTPHGRESSRVCRAVPCACLAIAAGGPCDEDARCRATHSCQVQVVTFKRLREHMHVLRAVHGRGAFLVACARTLFPFRFTLRVPPRCFAVDSRGSGDRNFPGKFWKGLEPLGLELGRGSNPCFYEDCVKKLVAMPGDRSRC